MKKIWIVALCLILSLTLVACGNNPAPSNPDENSTPTSGVQNPPSQDGVTTTTIPAGNIVDGNDFFGEPTTTTTTGTTKKGETTTTTTTTTTTVPTTTIAPPVQEEIKNVKVPAAGYDMDGKKRIVVEKSEVNAKKTAATFTFKNVSKDNGREWIIPEYSKVVYACYDKKGKEIATGYVTLGSMEYGDTVICEVALPSGTVEVKFTGHNLEYWTPWK